MQILTIVKLIKLKKKRHCVFNKKKIFYQWLQEVYD